MNREEIIKFSDMILQAEDATDEAKDFASSVKRICMNINKCFEESKKLTDQVADKYDEYGIGELSGILKMSDIYSKLNDTEILKIKG